MIHNSFWKVQFDLTRSHIPLLDIHVNLQFGHHFSYGSPIISTPRWSPVDLGTSSRHHAKLIFINSIVGLQLTSIPRVDILLSWSLSTSIYSWHLWSTSTSPSLSPVFTIRAYYAWVTQATHMQIVHMVIVDHFPIDHVESSHWQPSSILRSTTNINLHDYIYQST